MHDTSNTPSLNDLSCYTFEELRLLDVWCAADVEEQVERDLGDKSSFPLPGETVFDRAVLLCVSKQLTLEKLKELLCEDEDLLLKRNWVGNLYLVGVLEGVEGCCHVMSFRFVSFRFVSCQVKS